MNLPKGHKLRLVFVSSAFAISVSVLLVWRGLNPAPQPAVEPPDLSKYSDINVQDTELVADYGAGKLSPIRSTHLLTGATVNNPTHPGELRFYKRLIFGTRTDILDEKNNCHFRVRLKSKSTPPPRPEDLLLLIWTSRDKQTLRFEKVAGDIASEPYICVDAIRLPMVPGLHELITSPAQPYHSRVLRRIPPLPENIR